MGAVGVGAIIAGTAIDAYGRYKANQAQADADEQNAAFYREQADFAQKAGDREINVYEDEANQFEGSQKSSYARGGVELSGSPLLAFGDTKFREMQQVDAIKQKTAQSVLEASLRGTSAQNSADSLNSFAGQALPLAGTLLTGLSNAAVVSAASGGKGKIRTP